MQELSVVILNWNASEDTIRCARQVASWTSIRSLVWVVDNASSEESVRAVREACPDVRLIRNAENQGFAGGSNRGIEASLAVDERPVLLLNNDASLAEEDALHLLATMEANETVGMLAPLLREKGSGALISAGNRNPVLHHHTRLLQYDESRPLNEVAFVSGTCVLIRAALFREVGLLDEAYFFSTEMADLCMRARRHGFSCAVDTRATASHDLQRSGAERSSLYTYYIIRNRFLFLRKFYGPLRRGALWSIWSSYGVALALKLMREGRHETACAVRLGQWDAWRARYGGQNERVRERCLRTRRSHRPRE